MVVDHLKCDTPGGDTSITRPWHTITPEEALQILKSSTSGLTEEDARDRLIKNGPNELERIPGPSPLKIFIRQFENYLVIVLMVASAISWISGERTNAYVVLGILIFITLLGLYQEFKAEKAMDALRRMVSPEADVIRGGRTVTVAAKDLVPGDLIYVEAGDTVPADARIIESSSFQTIESSLTGESVPVLKDASPLPAETPCIAGKKQHDLHGDIGSVRKCESPGHIHRTQD